jgi:hypothetical protein
VDAVRHRVSCAGHHHGAELDVAQRTMVLPPVKERQRLIPQQIFLRVAHPQLVLRSLTGGRVQIALAQRLPGVSDRQRVRQPMRLPVPLVLLSTNCAAGHPNVFPSRIGLRWHAEQQVPELASARQVQRLRLVLRPVLRRAQACGFSFSRRRRILTGRG